MVTFFQNSRSRVALDSFSIKMYVKWANSIPGWGHFMGGQNFHSCGQNLKQQFVFVTKLVNLYRESSSIVFSTVFLAHRTIERLSFYRFLFCVSEILLSLHHVLDRSSTLRRSRGASAFEFDARHNCPPVRRPLFLLVLSFTLYESSSRSAKNRRAIFTGF